MENDKHTPSLEHSRLLILERIEYAKTRLWHAENSEGESEAVSIFNQELAGHEQGLKALDSHYALLEALKEAHEELKSHNWRIVHTNKGRERLKLIKQCEG